MPWFSRRIFVQLQHDLSAVILEATVLGFSLVTSSIWVSNPSSQAGFYGSHELASIKTQWDMLIAFQEIPMTFHAKPSTKTYYLYHLLPQGAGKKWILPHETAAWHTFGHPSAPRSSSWHPCSDAFHSWNTVWLDVNSTCWAITSRHCWEHGNTGKPQKNQWASFEIMP